MYDIQSIKKKMDSGQLVIIGNALLSDPSVSEMFGFCGCDMVWIDMEHGAIDNKDVQRHIIAAHSGGAASFVRIPGNEPDMVKKVLDMGADGILFPLVHSVQEVKEAIASCRYPPKGIRGWNPIRAAKYGVVDGSWYMNHADELIFRMVMMEDIGAARNIEQILEVDGLDAIMIGPCDLSGSMGRLTDIYAEPVQEVIREVVRKCRDAGKYVGVALGCGASVELYRYWIDMGIQMLSFGQDVNLLVQAVQSNLQHIQMALGTEETF